MKIYATTITPKSSSRVLIVGGGIGGLAAAGRLARSGASVTLLEKNEITGGRVASIQLGDVRFDTGPSLLLFKDKYEEALVEGMGSDMVEITRVAPAAYRVFFEDNSHIDILNDQKEMEEQLEAIERGAGEQYRKFVAMARQNLEIGVPYFIDRDFNELADAKGLQDLLPKISSINPVNLLAPHDWVMSKFFKDPRLRALFTFQDLYVGLSPSTAPAVFSLLAGTEITDGIWYPIGGFGKVAEHFTNAARACGVDIRTNAQITKINVDQGRVHSVTLDNGEVIEADVILCNRDLPLAYELLEGSSSDTSSSTSVEDYAQRKSKQLAGFQYSTGVISYNWVLKERLPKLLHHSIFLSGDYKRSWKPAASPEELLQRPNFYVHCPARSDPTSAPQGKDSVMVLLPVANMKPSSGYIDGKNAQVDYDGLIEAGRQRIFNAFKEVGVSGDVGSLIEEELIIAPPEWEEKYSLKYGAAFGLSHGLNQLSLFRPSNKDGMIEGLYFVGASTRPGNGVPLSLISAKLAAQRIAKDYGLK